ncbi:MAG: GGDEF domain-containing protein [Rhodospirillaceae bacterium]|nr:GGDEF domain-containing protein [Rhodospirillaceae bacterium]
MADISEAAPIRVILSADKHAKDKQHKRDPEAEHQADKDHPQRGGGFYDPTTIMGIPAAEVTPRVQETLTNLMVEFDSTRAELKSAKAHIQYLEELSESHSYLPIINRRGLHRELSRMLALAERAEISNTFVCFHIRNIQDIRRKYGLGAAENALIWAAEILNAGIRDTDVIGSLGGHDLGVILTVAEAESAADLAAKLAEALEQGAFPWDGERLSLKTAHGQHTFRPGDSAETVMAGADADLLAHEQAAANG